MNGFLEIKVASLFLIITILLSAFGYAYYHNTRLFFYLKKNNYERWRTITTIKHFGPGSSNPIRWFKYLTNTEDTEDNIILRHKDAVKIGFKISIFAIIGIVVNLIIIALTVPK